MSFGLAVAVDANLRFLSNTISFGYASSLLFSFHTVASCMRTRTRTTRKRKGRYFWILGEARMSIKGAQSYQPRGSSIYIECAKGGHSVKALLTEDGVERFGGSLRAGAFVQHFPMYMEDFHASRLD